jgi:hypothetical protein
MTYNYNNLSAKIIIKKTKFFGLFKKYAIIVVLPSFKIVKIQTNISDLPFEEKNILNIEELLFYVNTKKYKIYYHTNNKILKRLLDSL